MLAFAEWSQYKWNRFGFIKPVEYAFASQEKTNPSSMDPGETNTYIT